MNVIIGRGVDATTSGDQITDELFFNDLIKFIKDCNDAEEVRDRRSSRWYGIFEWFAEWEYNNKFDKLKADLFKKIAENKTYLTFSEPSHHEVPIYLVI